MEVWLDRSVQGDVQLGGYRPDVVSHFGRPDYLLSSWIATVSLRAVEPGLHQVEVLAYSSVGERVSCGVRDLRVRPFPRPPEPPAWRTELALLSRVIASILWLAFIGWGPMRLVGGRAICLAPPIGLSLVAIATEAGSAANIRPLSSALVLTAFSAVVLVSSARRHALRLRKLNATTIGAFAIAAVFALVGSLPLVRHGAGSILGSINDAVWECSVADSIARYGWTIPKDVHGLLAAVPSVWRAANFRAGVPYPLALLTQVFRVRAHEVHSVLTLAVGSLVVWAAASLAGYLFRYLRWTRVVAIGLVGVNSILFAQLYHQHTGVLIATLLYLSFVYSLLALIPGRGVASILPTGILIAGAWTLYPETMVLWVLTAALFLGLLSRSFRDLKKKFIRLGLAAILAALVNPIGLVRTARFTNALRHATALETAELRTAFGDTHYFPSAAVIAGLRPYRIDWPSAEGGLDRAVVAVSAGLLLLAALVGLSRARGRSLRLLIVLLAPSSLWLFMNRLWQFPYGYSKGLPHIVPLWALAVTILAARASGARAGTAARRLTAVTLFLLAGVSLLAAADVVGRAVRGVPGYDPAFRTLPELVTGIDRNSVIVAPEPLDFRREWIAYFLGEYKVVRTREEAGSPTVRPIYEILDRRGDRPTAPSSVVRSNDFFALVRS
jgi:hypothetical protein